MQGAQPLVLVHDVYLIVVEELLQLGVVILNYNNGFNNSKKHTGGTSNMEFITVVENNDTYYLQYTGNEEALEKLYGDIQDAKWDYWSIHMDLTQKFSENVVDHRCARDYRHRSHKVVGTFKYTVNTDYMQAMEIADALEKEHSNGRIAEYFT